MKVCPLRFDHPSEAQQLHGLGPKLCDRLADKLRAHCAASGLPMPQLPHRGTKRHSDDEGATSPKPAKKSRKTNPYVPILRSGAYALVLALASLEDDASQGLTKAEAVELAQPHCDSSFTAPSDPTKFYTAWNSMKTLVGKDLVYEHGRPIRRYMLTDEGWEVARRILVTESGSIKSLLANGSTSKTPGDKLSTRSVQPDKQLDVPGIATTISRQSHFDMTVLPSNSEQERSSSLLHRDNASNHLSLNQEKEPGHRVEGIPTFTPIILPEGSFSVQLVLDSREVRTKTDRDYISSELSKLGINAMTRPLPLGDALWIATPNPGQEHILTEGNIGDDGEGHEEIVLDHIIERKRLDDLIGSIKDGRFHEQKFRLRKSGIKNVTYVVEDFSISAENGEKYGDAVASAIASTQVVNGYFVKQTAKLDDTIRYLARMTRMLRTMYEVQPLRIIPSRVLDPKTYLPLMTHLRDSRATVGHYITFSAFSSLCSKSDTMSLRDVYLKMLMCTRGVTGEKALEIQKRWQTPVEFIEAYSVLEGQKAKDVMVSEKLGGLIPRKKVARGLSRKLAEVWA